MTLQIIGSGFGRTGTMTMKDALGTLSFGPTHHMVEILENPGQLNLWKGHFAGETVDWQDVFAGYNSQVDWPGASVWHQTFTTFPNAQVIHTERPEQEWWASFSKTIGKLFGLYQTLPLPPHINVATALMTEGLFENGYGDFKDKDAMIEAYRANNQKVRETIPAEQLLVFNVTEGWAPLCAFLNVAIPDTPFPHHNVRNDFWAVFGGEPVEA
jgi:hypothetical protein